MRAYNYVVTFGERKSHICVPSVADTVKVVDSHITISEWNVFLKLINNIKSIIFQMMYANDYFTW